MKILLVHPACLDTRLTDADALAVPMGLFYIGAQLKEDGFDVEVLNLAPVEKPMATLCAGVAKHQPAVVGFSVLHANRHSAMDGVAAVKALNPDIATVFGGPAATFSSDLFLKQCPGLDFIVQGEGERIFLQLVRSLKEKTATFKRRSVLNGGHRQCSSTLTSDGSFNEKAQCFGHEGCHWNPSEPLISDLDSLPHPAAYFDFQHLSLSRGCPGKCRFCGSPDFWGRGKVRFHSTQWFVDELELLTKRGRTHFFISDDTFTMSKKRVLAVCHEIKKRQLNITWQAISRVDFVDDEILKTMRLAGCIQISFGVESGSETIRKALGKPFKNEKIIHAFQRTVAHGILPRAYFIYGSPGETKKSIEQSVGLIQKMKPLSMVSYILVIFPGTALYDASVKKGRISPEAWEQKVEDIPWFEVDPDLDFDQVRAFGHQLRKGFYAKVHRFAQKIELVDDPALYPYHADFLSRLAMTFSHGEYARHPEVIQQEKTANLLYQRALNYAPDPRAYLGLAMTHQKQQNFQSAISLLKTALTHFSTDRQLNICMAITLMNLGDFKSALHYLEPFSSHGDVTHYIDACHQHLA